jgi:hypothetical protein
MTNSGEKEERH